MLAGAEYDDPLDGLVSDTVGGLFGGGGPPAVVKLQRGPDAVRNAIVFDTIFQ
jgi:hypothetical protein